MGAAARTGHRALGHADPRPALGLDCGPMSGFDNAAVDAAFFAETPLGKSGRVKSNFISTLGYGDPATIFVRSPRPAFEKFNQLA